MNREFIFMLIISLVFGCIFGIIGIILTENLFLGFKFGFFWSIIFGLMAMFIYPNKRLKTELKVRSYPNKGIFRTLLTTIAMTILSILCWFLVLIFLDLKTGREADIINVITQSVKLGLLSRLTSEGGNALVQHFSLRLVLYRRGRMPWNYAKFLTEASQTGILKQSGGSFRFYHDKLREHLAKDMQF